MVLTLFSEVEADYIGLLFMAQACYDPREAMNLWGRMQEAGRGPQPPAFMSTHPGHSERIEKIKSWQDEARQKYENAGCYERSGNYLDGFFKRSS